MNKAGMRQTIPKNSLSVCYAVYLSNHLSYALCFTSVVYKNPIPAHSTEIYCSCRLICCYRILHSLKVMPFTISKWYMNQNGVTFAMKHSKKNQNFVSLEQECTVAMIAFWFPSRLTLGIAVLSDELWGTQTSHGDGSAWASTSCEAKEEIWQEYMFSSGTRTATCNFVIHSTLETKFDTLNLNLIKVAVSTQQSH